MVGGGWYGAHISLALIKAGADVELWESAETLFTGASGGNPARLHKGFHYPRSYLTRAACQDHAEAFMARYGALTRAIPINLYAVAAHDSMVDFGTYRQVLRPEVPFIPVFDPAEFGLRNVEGAVLTGERHIVIRLAREAFTRDLAAVARYGARPDVLDDPKWDWNVDTTFCSFDAEAIDRYEPCITTLLEGPTDKAVTVMDGRFPSIYPWDEEAGLCSLTSASLTPFSKTCRTWTDAKAVLDGLSHQDIADRMVAMLAQMAHFWPAAADLYKIADFRLSIRAMPRSGADARLVDVVQTGERVLRVRAGKIDAVFRAEALIKERIGL